MGPHPHHDAVAAEVRSWYTDRPGRGPGPAGSVPEAGVRSSKETFGYLRNGPGRWDRRVVLTVDDSAALAPALAEAEALYGSADFDVWIDDRRRAAALESGLLAAGFSAPADNTAVLALVGTLGHGQEPEDMELREVLDEESLETWSRVKLMAFADGEDDPPSASLDQEMAARRSERSIARYELALIGSEPAGIVGHYTASVDKMVFLLGTRVPFRHRGVAHGLLRRWAERAQAQGARSLLINCDENGRPAQLYRRLGFTDLVYWHRRYQRHASSGR